MRLLLPQLDNERPTYGLRESSLAETYIQALGLKNLSFLKQTAVGIMDLTSPLHVCLYIQILMLNVVLTPCYSFVFFIFFFTATPFPQ